MIYREGERLNEQDLSDKIEILKDIFPTYFRKDNPLPIIIDFVKSAKYSVELFRPGGDVSAGRKLKSPQDRSIISIGYENSNGFQSEIRYTERAPIFNGNSISWGKSKITLGEKTQLKPVVDLEKLIFLWFYCDHITNNECVKKRGDAKFEFIIPEKQIGSKYDNIAFRRQIEDEILIEGTRISYEALCNIAESMGIKLRGEEKVDRVTFFDSIINSNDRINKYKALKSSIVLEKKSTVSEVVELTQVKNIVASLVDSLKIFDDEKGAWRIKGPGKPKFLCDIEGETPEEKLFNLVEFVSNNPEVLQSVKSLVK
jgi:hypothetical protein